MTRSAIPSPLVEATTILLEHHTCIYSCCSQNSSGCTDCHLPKGRKIPAVHGARAAMQSKIMEKPTIHQAVTTLSLCLIVGMPVIGYRHTYAMAEHASDAARTRDKTGRSMQCDASSVRLHNCHDGPGELHEDSPVQRHMGRGGCADGLARLGCDLHAHSVGLLWG